MRTANKLEFHTLRQTVHFPFHHGHVSTDVIYLYTIYIFFFSECDLHGVPEYWIG